MSIEEWGAVIKLARRASHLAMEDAVRAERIKDRLGSAILLYTDDPTAATWLAASRDMADICGCSEIEGVAIVMGEHFPPSAFEAERADLGMPRIAALWFPATGNKCPRCRKCTADQQECLCERCATILDEAA